MALVKTVPYTIIVKTADLPTAGIAATVFIKVHGDKLSVKPIELGPNVKKRTAISQSPFSRNCTSHFSVTREDVGQITYIDVWHDAPQKWGCEFIEVQKGNDSWLFTPEEPVNNQVSTDVTAGVPKPTRLVGEHSMVSNGANRLHNAAKYGDDKSLEKILQNNEFKVDVEDRLGRTPAMYACLYGQVTCLDILIEYEANLMKKDKSGKQCLHHACVNHKNNIEIITHLIESAPEVIGGAADEPDEIRNSDPGQARIMRYVRDRDGYGKNAMHYAATYGFVPVIQLLESKCRIAIRDKDHTGQTPLHCAAIQGETQAVLCLIELGCTVNAVDREQKTFLHQAATAGHADLISTVMKHVFPPNVKKTLDSLVQYEDTCKRTPLLCAAFNAKLDAVKVLVQSGADIYHVDEDKCNALHLAARTGDERILAFLSQQLDVNSTNNYGFTALHVAADANNRVAVQWLLKHQADVFAQTEAGESAKALAEGKGFKELVAALSTAESVQKQNKVLDKEKENAEAVAALAKAVPQVAAAVAAPPVDTMAQTPIMPPVVTPPRTAIQYEAAPNIDGARFTEIEEATSRVQELEHLVKDQRKQIAVLRDRLTVAAAITTNSAGATPAGPSGIKKPPPRACEEGCVIS